jgi:DNA adenine methylase
VKPFIKWAGGKSQLLSQYEPYLPKSFHTYYEPFLGGGAVFFHLKPERAVLSDSNEHLVTTYYCVRDYLDDLVALLQEHKARHCSDYYYQVRSHQPTTELEQAAKFIYLNKTCFNGLYRVNSKGLFNVPIGSYKDPAICDVDALSAASAALQGADLDVADFQVVADRATADDFVYLDPPYAPISDTSDFTGYTKDRFGEADQIRLRDLFTKLAWRGVKVALSNSDCLFIRELYQDFQIIEVQAGRAINSNGSSRGKISELLIVSY